VATIRAGYNKARHSQNFYREGNESTTNIQRKRASCTLDIILLKLLWQTQKWGFTVGNNKLTIIAI
jgi:hypothetical protein